MKPNSNDLRNWIAVIAAAMFVVCGLTHCQAQIVVWSQNFELGWGDWHQDSTSGSAWGIGSPASGPPLDAQGARAYAGTNCAATGLSATPAAYMDTRLVSPPFVVPAASQSPRLRFWHWFDLDTFNTDQAWVEISVSGGDWIRISPVYSGSSGGGWARLWLDLVAYAGKSVCLAFHYISSATPHRGWFVDEVLIETNPFPPGITQGPSSLVVTQGQTAAFAVLATGSAPLYYQWSLNLTNLINAGRISGAESSALFITNVQAGDAGLYSVVVSNSVGVVSTNATLTVLVPPYIISPPQGQTVLAGSDVTFTVIAGGTTPLAYQWQFNGSNLLNQTAASLTLSNVQSAQAGNYTVVVSNAINVISATAPLNVLQLPLLWASDDIGDVAARGSAVYSNGVFTVTGSGEDIQGTEDAFQFVQQPLTGDGQIVARFLALQGGEPLGLAGHQVLGGFKMLLAGDVGDWLAIKATRDFANWADLRTVTNLYGVVDFLDTQALTNTYRFYRAQRVGP